MGDGVWLIFGADLRLTELAVYVTEGSAVWEELVPFISSETLFRLGLNFYCKNNAVDKHDIKIFTSEVLQWDFEQGGAWGSSAGFCTWLGFWQRGSVCDEVPLRHCCSKTSRGAWPATSCCLEKLPEKSQILDNIQIFVFKIVTLETVWGDILSDGGMFDEGVGSDVLGDDLCTTQSSILNPWCMAGDLTIPGVVTSAWSAAEAF